MLCYETNVNEFHTLINSVTEELKKSMVFDAKTRIEAVNVEVLILSCIIKKKGGDYKAEALSVSKRRAIIIPEKSVVYHCMWYNYKHCGLPGLPGSMYTLQNWIFTHVGLSAHAHNIIIVQKVGWLLSGIEELTILCCSFFIVL